VARPIKHRGKWRVRWFDEHGRRQSEVCDDHRAAAFRLREHEHEVEEIRRGLRSSIVPDKATPRH
jgi:hypothetical protein